MSQEDIRLTLNKLKKEIDGLESNSTTSKELYQLMDELEQLLQARENTLIDDVRHQIEKLETEHPKITNILSEIMIKLINIGV